MQLLSEKCYFHFSLHLHNCSRENATSNFHYTNMWLQLVIFTNSTDNYYLRYATSIFHYIYITAVEKSLHPIFTTSTCDYSWNFTNSTYKYYFRNRCIHFSLQLHNCCREIATSIFQYTNLALQMKVFTSSIYNNCLRKRYVSNFHYINISLWTYHYSWEIAASNFHYINIPPQ